MPRVRTARIALDGSERNELSFKYDINVNTEGLFTTTIPGDIADLMSKAGIDLERNRARNLGYISSETMDDLEEMVSNVCKEYLSRELIEEKLIIKYQIDTSCSYCIEDGEIVPNGSYCKDYKWINGTHDINSSNTSSFGLLVYVKPYVKKTYSYKSGATKIEYERISCFGSGTVGLDKNLKWLADIPNIEETGRSTVKEIEYTEDVALFL